MEVYGKAWITHMKIMDTLRCTLAVEKPQWNNVKRALWKDLMSSFA